MSFVKKTIASAAAIAALVAVPTATAVADDASAQDTATVQAQASSVNSITVGAWTVYDSTMGISNPTYVVDDLNAVNPHDIWASGGNVYLGTQRTDGKTFLIVQYYDDAGNTYDVTFTRTPSSDTTVTSLTAGGYNVDLAKAATVEGDFIEVADLSAVDFAAVGGSWAYGVTVTKAAETDGDGYARILYMVAAEDGTQGPTYTVTFQQTKKSSDTTLTDLSVDGYHIDLDAAATVEGYTIEVDDPSAVNPEAISGSWAKGSDVKLGATAEGKNKVSYTYYVVAEDGTTGKVAYQVNFVKSPSTDTHITNLIVDGDYAIDLTQAATSEGYTIAVADPFAVDPTVIAGSWAAGADVKLGATVEGKNKVSYTYYVVAEDGKTQGPDYKVTFVKAKNSATTLSTLTVDGYVVYEPAQGLTDATTTDGHVITVDDPSAIDPNVIGGAWAAGADVKLGATVEGKNKVSYTYYVVAEDGTQGTASYKVTFKKAKKSSDATLTTLTVDGYVAYDAVKGPFDATTTDGHTFVVDDPSAIDPSVIGGAWAAGADVLLGGSSEAADGSSVSYFYYVVAEDGTRSEVTYKVNFVKAQDGETPTEPEEPGKDDETTTPAEDEQKADENKPDEKKSALGETGSAVLGVSVFALLLAAGSAVIFVMRKRA